jgi:hypothetical protein
MRLSRNLKGISRIFKCPKHGCNYLIVRQPSRINSVNSQLKKNGHMHNGKQHHYCHDCGRQCVRGFEPYLIAEDKRTLIARLRLERIAEPEKCETE